MNQKTIAKMTGYKATDKDMRCQGHQFELGVWYWDETRYLQAFNGIQNDRCVRYDVPLDPRPPAKGVRFR